ncbi:TetR/AcrR family transcriptional regulator [Microbacterium phyllosphaerae]|uniref:TetR/AcrR family transcriptional regulator n=1 Tax=Microbacterium phyllosphaerae TaxID=124798 RepID=UPI000EA1ED51|nr:TetR/AcrR family transcriptional regulator [Microbacterium phyllosphaerae]
MTDRSTSRGTYAKTPARRQEILDAAFEVFSEKGYERGSVRDIADRVGMSHTAVLFHFKTKVDLLAAVLEERDRRSRQRFSVSLTSPLDQILAFVDLVRDNLEDPGMIELYSVLLAEATAAGHPAHEFFRGRYDWILDFAEEGLVRMQEQGILREGVDPGYAARAMIAVSDGLQLQFLYRSGAEQMLDDLRAFVSSLLAVPLRRD